MNIYSWTVTPQTDMQYHKMKLKIQQKDSLEAEQ